MIRLAIRILMNQQVHWNVIRVLNLAQWKIVMILVVILPFFHYVRDNTVHQFWSLRSAPGWRWWWRHWARQSGKAGKWQLIELGMYPPVFFHATNSWVPWIDSQSISKTKTDQPFKNPSQNEQESWFMLLSHHPAILRYTSWLLQESLLSWSTWQVHDERFASHPIRSIWV